MSIPAIVAILIFLIVLAVWFIALNLGYQLGLDHAENEE